MNGKTLVVYRPTIKEALEHLDDFQDKMNQFVEKHPNYSYSSTLSDTKTGWKVMVKIEKDEQENLSTT